MLILFFCLVCIYVSQCKITIKDVGVATLTRGDVGIIFCEYLPRQFEYNLLYESLNLVDVTLHNMGNCKYHIDVKMIKCCETFAENDMDCQLMNLIGSDMGLLHPNITKNISLLYPNMYLHNRKGQCLISVKYTTEKSRTFEVIKKIAFDTFINETHITPILRGYYNMCEFTKCKTVDQDPLENCEPINCHMKYLGSRNYFSHKWKRCQKVPICIADPEKDLPDVSYLPISNMCRDLEDLISIDDLKYLEKGIIEGYWEHQPTPALSANLRCHHGTLSNETGFCVCDDGWMSVPLDKDQYEPSLSIYHMCNIEIGTWNGVNSTKIKMTALVLLIFGGLTATCMVMLSVMCHFFYKCVITRASALPLHSESATPYSSETETSKSNDCGDISPKSLSRETMKTFTSCGSVETAANRDSVIFQRKSMDFRKGVTDSALRIVQRISHQHSSESDGTTASCNSKGISYAEKTEPFQPTRSP